MTACVARLAGQDREEHRQGHHLLNRLFEQTNHRRRQEGREQIELEPRVTKPQAPAPRSSQPVFVFHTDHAPRLGADLDRLLLEEDIPAHQTDQTSRFIADRIDRIMAGDHERHGVGHVHLGAQMEWLPEHNLA